MNYLIALHIIAVVCWFAGLFYLPRIFVYHAATDNSEVKAQFYVMERKLYYYIMMPAMGVTLFSGLYLMTLYVFEESVPMGWLWVKLALVLLLVIFHFFCGHCIQVFHQDKNLHSPKFYRIMNEVPTVLLIAIVLLAVVQPF